LKVTVPTVKGAEPGGSTIPLAGFVPRVVSPSLSQNSPATLSHPLSAFKSASVWLRHLLMESLYGSPLGDRFALKRLAMAKRQATLIIADATALVGQCVGIASLLGVQIQIAACEQTKMPLNLAVQEHCN
jgi:hypothetical protein